MHPILKPLGKSLAVLTIVLLFGITVIYTLSSFRLNRKHNIPPLPQITLSSDSLILAKGQHLATGTVNCVQCHGDDLGGKIYVDAGALGIIVGPNLTGGKGGIGKTFSNQDWVRAIRHGIRKDGSSLMVMPSETFVHMSAQDLSALISYLKQLPAVDRELPPTRLGFLGRMMLVAGKFSILVAEKTPHQTPFRQLSPDSTLAYGSYLADISGCKGCHGQHLSGGPVIGPPGTPVTSNLTPAGNIGTWTETEFVRTLRTGRRPDGRPIDNFMPWQLAGRMNDEELHALWLYLKSVPPMETGHR
jgi:mono/diheme cytochrome c family protein